MNIGFHVSTTKGFDDAVKVSSKYGANIFQFFPRNPRGAKARKIEENEIYLFKDIVKEYDFGPIICHGSYTMNLSSNKESVIEGSKELMSDDFKRINRLGIKNYVFHPGSHVGQGDEKGLDLIIEGLNEILLEEYDFNLCLETMSGKGTELGKTFEQLKYIIDNVKYKNIGVCMDSCHLYSAGYDIKNDLDKVLFEFDTIVGIDRLKVMHLNDSMTEFNSRKDRHEKIGEGSLGIETFENIVNNRYLKDIPFILETPNELSGYREEIELLNRLRN